LAPCPVPTRIAVGVANPSAHGQATTSTATAGIIDGAFGSTGQRCTATSRTIVVESVADRLLDKLLTRARMLKVGDGLDDLG